MAFRRTKQDATDGRRWRAFTAVHGDAIRTMGLGVAVAGSQEHFVDFLEHGYLDHHGDPAATSSWSYDDARLMKLVDLRAAYFGEFGNAFAPMALPHVRYHEALNDRLRRSPVS